MSGTVSLLSDLLGKGHIKDDDEYIGEGTRGERVLGRGTSLVRSPEQGSLGRYGFGEEKKDRQGWHM